MPQAETVAKKTTEAALPTVEQLVDAVVARLQKTSLGSWYSVGQLAGQLGKWSVTEILTAAANLGEPTLIINGVVHYPEDAMPRIKSYFELSDIARRSGFSRPIRSNGR